MSPFLNSFNLSWNVVFQELNRSFPSFKTLTFTTRLSAKPLLWKWNCLRDTTTFLMWWLQTNLSKFDSVLNVTNQVKFRRICIPWSHLSLTGLISQRQFAPKCRFLVSMPFVLLECPEKSQYFTSLIFMKSHFRTLWGKSIVLAHVKCSVSTFLLRGNSRYCGYPWDTFGIPSGQSVTVLASSVNP